MEVIYLYRSQQKCTVLWKKNIYNLLLLEKVTPSFDVASLALVDLEVELLQHQIQGGDCQSTEEDHVGSLQD